MILHVRLQWSSVALFSPAHVFIWASRWNLSTTSYHIQNTTISGDEHVVPPSKVQLPAPGGGGGSAECRCQAR